jgi:DNA topoisomerase-2
LFPLLYLPFVEWHVLTDRLEIKNSEIPIHKATTAYRAKVLEEQNLNEGLIKGFKEHHSDLHVDFTVETTEENMAKFEAEGLEKHFGLVGSCSINNMVLFDHHGKLKKFKYIFVTITAFRCFSQLLIVTLHDNSSPNEILQEWYELRLPYYEKRKEWLQGKLESEVTRINNKLRFILAVIADELKIRNIKKKGNTY